MKSWTMGKNVNEGEEEQEKIISLLHVIWASDAAKQLSQAQCMRMNANDKLIS